MKNKLILNSFYLKIIAMVVILLDHIGFIFYQYLPADIYTTLRVLGRLGFPLYAFFIVEGLINTRHSGKYIFRIFLMLLLVTTFQLVAFFSPLGQAIGGLNSAYNVFITLIVGAITIYYFRSKKYKHVYLLLPLIAAIIVNIVQEFNPPSWLYFFKNDYGLYGIIMILGFYLARVLTKPTIKFLASQYHVTYHTFHNEFIERETINILSSISLLFITLIWYILSITTSFVPSVGIQPYAIFTGLLILLYNGKRGYSAPWFRWFYYLFYPGHLALLAVISMIIMLVN
jgi:hypothetical protein